MIGLDYEAVLSLQQKISAMKNIILFSQIMLLALTVKAQQKEKLNFGDTLTKEISKADSFHYSLHFEAGGIYQFVLRQQGIGIYYNLADQTGKLLLESDTPEDLDDVERFEYEATESGHYTLTVTRFEHPENTSSGKFQLSAISLSPNDLSRRKKIKRELLAENQKIVQTLDIDHFWEAFDLLRGAHSFVDSCRIIQEAYLDRATDGMKDFIRVRDLSAEKYVDMVARYPKYLNSIRKRTYQAKNWEPEVEQIFDKFKRIYPDFQPFRVCFAIGILNTGGTVSNRFVLIGTEITVSSTDADLSEFGAGAFRDNLAFKGDISKKVSNLIAHECVHTQQASPGENDINCPLLSRSLREGAADFIGELVSGNAYTGNHSYGDAHEAELWQEFSQQLCNKSTDAWLYNYTTVKGRPADLGYYIGYRITRSYYEHATDKKDAISRIINMKDPKAFLETSGYNPKD